MADTNGIAALMKALNDTPTLGGGLNKSSGAQRNAKTATIKQTSFVVPNSTSQSAGVIRAASKSPAASAPLPKILTPEGRSLDPKAPRGSYLNLLV